MEVKKSITVNGQTYNSVEELPPELRALCERALQAGRRGSDVAHVTSKITLNGREIGSFNELPLPARLLVRCLGWFVKSQAADTAPRTSGNLAAPAAGRPRPGIIRPLIIWLLMVATMFAWFFLYRGRG